MKKVFINGQDRSGNVAVNATVTVREYPSGDTATIYSANHGATKSNPFTTDANGGGAFYAANGRYTIEIEGGGIAAQVHQDVVVFDVEDASLNSTQVEGIGDLSAQANYDVLISDGARFRVVSLPGSVFDDRYLVGSQGNPDWLRLNAARVGNDTGVLEANNTSNGNLAAFFQNGVLKAKIQNDGSIHTLGELFVQLLATFGADVVIQGDLTVNGTVTHIDSTVVDIGDNIITLNSGTSGAPTQNAGIEIDRGTSANVRIIWNEAKNRWEWDGHTIPGLDVADTWTAEQTHLAPITLDNETVLFGKRTNGTKITLALVDGNNFAILGDHGAPNEQRSNDLNNFRFSADGSVVRPFRWRSVNSSFSVDDGDQVLADSSSQGLNCYLPQNPRRGARIDVVDAYGTWGSNHVNVIPGGDNILGVNENLIMDVSNATLSLVYVDSTRGWVLIQR